MICGITDALWDDPEVSFAEYKAMRLLTETLETYGFTVERGLVGIPTSFKATFGTGKPHLGILAEYDALSGLSQQAGVAVPAPIPGKDTYHGCGHHLFAGGSLAAALAVKAYIEQTGKGAVTLFGCPAEEGGGGKVYMARDGVFSDVDAVVSWHPEKMNMVRTRPALAMMKIDYTFEGLSAHAGSVPHLGRSALDAVELMNVGANFLREHMETTSRIHYAILDAGGTSPNVVQSHAVVQYMIRAVDAEEVSALAERIDRIAQGAALMTDTTYTSNVVASYANLITIPTLQSTANEALQELSVPVATEEELAFGRALQTTMPGANKLLEGPVFAECALQPAPPVAHGGSTDTADVSWVCPTVQMHIATWAIGTPGHSWQAEAQGKGGYAKKAMLYAGKAVSGTIMRLIDNPSLIEKAQAEHKEKVGNGYVCGLPMNMKPDFPEEM